MKKHFITYGTNRYSGSKFRLKDQVEQLNIFDSITLYDDTKITKEFKQKHKEVLSQQHGGGFWIWKFDIIKQKLNEIADGDYLVYLDAGCVINQAGKERFYEYFNMLNDSSYGIISFRTNYKEYTWTTSQIFNYFNINYNSEIGNSGHALGGILIMQKKRHLLKILDEVYKVLDYDDKLFTNIYNKEKQHPGFKDNRHDQSILSILRKIHGSIILSDETLSHLPESKKWPIWAMRLK